MKIGQYGTFCKCENGGIEEVTGFLICYMPSSAYPYTIGYNKEDTIETESFENGIIRKSFMDYKFFTPIFSYKNPYELSFGDYGRFWSDDEHNQDETHGFLAGFNLEVYNDLEVGFLLNDNVKKEILANEEIKNLNLSNLFQIIEQQNI